MSKTTQFGPEQQADICSLYATQRLSLTAIAKRYSVTAPTIRRVLIWNNVPRRGYSESTREDITGRTFGRLTAIQFTGEVGKLGHVWKFACSCGETVVIPAKHARKGDVLSCGCLQRDRAWETHFKDLTGQRVGRLVARSYEHRVPSTKSRWLCDCDCGRPASVPTTKLLSGHTQSCGCLRREALVARNNESGVDAFAMGTFYESERDAEFYVFTLANFTGYLKPGMDSTGTRPDGEYGEQLLSIQLPRIEAWLLEQAVLTETRLLASYPPELEGWAGYTELRRITPDALITIATGLHDQLLDLGRYDFALRYVPMTAEQAQQITMLTHAVA